MHLSFVGRSSTAYFNMTVDNGARIFKKKVCYILLLADFHGTLTPTAVDNLIKLKAINWNILGSSLRNTSHS